MLHVTTAYADAGNVDRLYDSSTLERFEFDMELGGAHLLGVDVAAVCEPKTLGQLVRLFPPPMIERLEGQMLGIGHRTEERAARVSQLISALFSSLLDPRSQYGNLQ